MWFKKVLSDLVSLEKLRINQDVGLGVSIRGRVLVTKFTVYNSQVSPYQTPSEPEYMLCDQ